jgi:hypothetical protein
MTSHERLAKLHLNDTVLLDSTEYTVKLINRATETLQLHPKRGGAHLWANVELIRLVGETDQEHSSV